MPDPTGFWLVRHALVEPAARAVLYGQTDVHVCALTMEQQGAAYAALAARLPRPAHWYVTPLSRTTRTAEAIFRGGYPQAPLVTEAAFVEQNLGEWQGLPHAELPARLTRPAHEFWPLAGDEQPPGGETIGAVTTRVGEALERLAVDHAGRDVVIVAHGGSIRAAVAHALDLRPDQALAFSIQNLSLTRLERHRTRWKVVCVNEAPGA